MVEYEASLSNPESIARAQKVKKAIEALGGSVRITPPNKQGMAMVTLRLPLRYRPEDFFPGLPFYPV